MLAKVSGHTDGVGDLDAQKLSLDLAQAIVNYLKEKGVEAGRMKALGCGAERPLEDRTTAFCQERNRRVEIKLIQKK